MSGVRALSLFSGGLDSILATRVVMAQGVDVLAVKFVSPFFHYDILRDVQGYVDEIQEKYGIRVLVEDISRPYLEMLRDPKYGFGKNFNPCIDCKIFMVSRAREMLAEQGASFLISGEVLGQRPMSQRRDTLNVISRDSDSRSLLLRPLSRGCSRRHWPKSGVGLIAMRFSISAVAAGPGRLPWPGNSALPIFRPRRGAVSWPTLSSVAGYEIFTTIPSL